MLRPVGSRVPLPKNRHKVSLPWEENYQTWLMGSGTEALSAAVMLAIEHCYREGTKPEVILPAYGCPDLIAAVVAQDATPILVDLQSDLPFMDTDKLVEAISHSTVAIVGVGFLGIPENLEKLASICSKNDVWLIEDSAQCFPPDCVREPLAECVVLSFGRGKPINLMGGGGLLVRKDNEAVASRCLARIPRLKRRINWQWRLKRHIFNFLLGRWVYGVLSRVPFMKLGITVYKPLLNLSRLELPDELLGAGLEKARTRPSVAAKYVQALAFLRPHGWQLFMEDLVAAEMQAGQRVLRYGVLAPNKAARTSAIERLNEKGVGANAFYGQSLPGIVGNAEILAASTSDYPNAVAFADRLITLPSHEDVVTSDIDSIASVFKNIIED